MSPGHVTGACHRGLRPDRSETSEVSDFLARDSEFRTLSDQFADKMVSIDMETGTTSPRTRVPIPQNVFTPQRVFTRRRGQA